MPELVAGDARKVELLSALVACDGMPVRAQKRLAAQGVTVKWTELQALREDNAAMYQALAVEHARASEEALTVEYRELARLGQRATRNYLEKVIEAQEANPDAMLDDKGLPQVIQALGKVMQVSTDKLLALTGRPTDGGAKDPLGAARELIEMGVLKPVERPALASVDGTAEEVN